MSATPIPESLQKLVETELEPDERAVWIDMPVARFFTPVSTPIFLFGLAWTAGLITTLLVTGECRLPGSVWLGAFSLFELAFVLVGLGMLLSPLWIRRNALRTVYVITDRRAVGIEGGWSTTFRSYYAEQLQEVFRRERKSGVGDVIIMREARRDSDGDGKPQEWGFFNIRDAKLVEGLLRDLAKRGERATH